MVRRGRGPNRLGEQAGAHFAPHAQSKLTNSAGFTLIELLVVIAVIVLLIAILLPALRKARNQTRAVVCRANLRHWGTILALYIEDNHGYLPRGSGYLSILRGLALYDDDPNQPEPVNPIDTKGIAFCPMATKTGMEVPAAFRAWETTLRGGPFHGSHGFNRPLFNAFFDPAVHTGKGSPNIFSLKDRANIPALVDATHYWVDVLAAEKDPPFREAFGSDWGICCINRHNAHVNGLFLDWSVRSIGLKELWTLKWYADFNTAGPWTRAGGVQPEDWPEWMRGFKDY